MSFQISRLAGRLDAQDTQFDLEAEPAASRVTFRLTSWPDLPPTLQTADVYRLLSFMSTRPVSRRWVYLRSPLPHEKTGMLLQFLQESKAVEVTSLASLSRRTG